MILHRRTALAAGLVWGASLIAAPLRAQALSPEPSVTLLALTHADGRRTDYRVLAPSQGGVWRVVLFSHGANSSFADYDRLWRPWAERGYLVIGANHIDTGPPATQRKVTRGELWAARLADTALPLARTAPFDAIAARAGARVDWSGVCAAGHSFGAVVAQALAGATLIAPGEAAAEHKLPAVSACIALSPPGPLKGFIPAEAWSTVQVPSLLQTGDADILPGFVDDWRLRLTGFAGGPDRWTVLGHGVNHYFHGLICRLTPDAKADLPALEETARLTGLFMDAYVKGQPGAISALKARAGKGDDGIAIFASV